MGPCPGGSRNCLTHPPTLLATAWKGLGLKASRDMAIPAQGLVWTTGRGWQEPDTLREGRNSPHKDVAWPGFWMVLLDQRGCHPPRLPPWARGVAGGGLRGGPPQDVQACWGGGWGGQGTSLARLGS